MTKSHKIRNVSAVLLLICFVLPLSKCTKTLVEVGPNGKAIESAEIHTENNYLVPINEIELSDPYSFLFLLQFFWPIPLWQLIKRVKNKKGLYCLRFIEAALMCFSTYCITIWTFYFGTPYWGGLLAVVCFFAIWVIYLLPILDRTIVLIKKRI